MKIGEYLTEAYVKPLGLSSQDVADATGLPRVTVSMVLADEYPMTLEIASLLSKAFNISMQQIALLAGDENFAVVHGNVKSLVDNNL